MSTLSENQKIWLGVGAGAAILLGFFLVLFLVILKDDDETNPSPTNPGPFNPVIQPTEPELSPTPAF
jgi:hypothetical protein